MARPKKIISATAEMVEAEQMEQVETFSEPVAATAGGYIVQWGIKVDGVRYQAGDSVSLSDDAAAPFLATGAIVKG